VELVFLREDSGHVAAEPEAETRHVDDPLPALVLARAPPRGGVKSWENGKSATQNLIETLPSLPKA
jgi:hypothetical protein